MKRVTSRVSAFVAFALLSAGAQADSLQSAIEGTQPLANFRLRFENVDQTGMAEEASAVTLRGRLGFKTGSTWHTSLVAEGEYIWPLSGDYNSMMNGRSTYPTIADPETAEINRLALTNTSLPGTTVALGRQSFTFDDGRFVASSSWRQNEQTFDAVSITNASVRNVTVSVAYLDQVNRNLGKDSRNGRYTGDSYLANVGAKTPFGKLSIFDYLTELEQSPRDTTQTAGLRFVGERVVGPVKLGYVASAANQRDRANNPLDFSLAYHLYELSGTRGAYTLRAGAEHLAGNGTKGFSTPLGSGHSIDGTADKFSSMPVNGLDNRYASIKYSRGQLGFFRDLGASVRYLSFSAARNGASYGDEVDLQFDAKWKGFTGMLKLADYRADGYSTDTRKIWMQVEYVL